MQMHPTKRHPIAAPLPAATAAEAISPRPLAHSAEPLHAPSLYATGFHDSSPQIVRLALAAEVLQIPEATVRDLRFYSEDRVTAKGKKISGNGFAPAFLKLGRSVYVDIPVFVEIWRTNQSKGASRG